jgi:FtsH-binding integral membrane protein
MQTTMSKTQPAVDEGLRSYMISVYNNMGIGLVISSIISYVIGTNEALASMVFGGPQAYLFIFAPLISVFALAFGIEKLSAATARLAFFGFAALMGISLSSIFLTYQLGSIFQVFLITAIMFGGMSLYGYTTKRDLTSMGSFLIMGLWGLVIASIINLFMQNSMMQLVIAAVGVIVFTGLTAYDTQKIKEIYYATSGEQRTKAGIMGALNLYLDFVNLMVSLIQLLGQRK